MKGSGTATTTYANRYYTVANTSAAATTTKHILGPKGETIATIEGNGSATSTYFNHADHLGGTNVVTDENGDLAQTLDYYPFGAQRINTKAGNFDEQYKFTGHEQDEDTDLTYAKQRYYGQEQGRFLSQDPAFLAIGTPELSEIVGRASGDTDQNNLKVDEVEKDRQALQQFLSDPQNLNSYSYTKNNPVNLTDPEGEFYQLLLLAIRTESAISLGKSGINLITTLFDSTSSAKERIDATKNFGVNLGQAALPGVGKAVGVLTKETAVGTEILFPALEFVGTVDDSLNSHQDDGNSQGSNREENEQD